ncbi:ATP-binding protein [Streptomyces sp. ST2-7A]|uniref:ATP-binding protein n=1 Tax=Streptomyces sp. ST2-7A TaxID=2907214 RepID=UPI001F300D9E|nr:ATP-binding protein [Streptomyces sp. ST2-7A]MCE7079997.1 ATP-binding protein [Streptomyces sp. ST2-7A]
MSKDGTRHDHHPDPGGHPAHRPGPVPVVPGPRAGDDVPPPTGLAAWLLSPRPPSPPGVWREGRVAKPDEDPGAMGDRELFGGALLALLGALLLWSLCWNGYIRIWLWPLEWVTTDAWRGTRLHVTATYAYYVLFALLLIWVFGRIGDWSRVWRRVRPGVLRLALVPADTPPLPVARTRRAVAALLAGALAWGLSFGGVWLFWLEPLWAVVPDSWWEEGDTTAYVVAYTIHYALWTALLVAVAALLGGWRGAARLLWGGRDAAYGSGGRDGEGAPLPDPTRWDELREAGLSRAADRLRADALSGAMNDVDHVRLAELWRRARSVPEARDAFGLAVEAEGAGALLHPSGARDLPVRTARHDPLTGQVLIGRAVPDERNPYSHRGEAVALDPEVLGTSLVAIGPPGSGKTGRVIRPVIEALCLRALAGRATVVAVGAAGAGLGADEAFDVLIRVGDPDSPYLLDPWGGCEDTDEAAALLAEALVGGGRDDPEEAAVAIAQLIGPYRAAYGHFPGVPELRALLDGATALLNTLHDDLGRSGGRAHQRDLVLRARQAERPDDIGRRLADRLGLLERAGVAGPADPARRARPFAVGVPDRPSRVRVDLPAGGHAEAGRIIVRLLLTRFASAVARRPDRTLFACLVLDDAASALTPGTVRALARLRPAGAGAVLALNSLDEVPEPLRPALLGTVGCRMAFSGITTWDAEHFARAWGKEWTEDRDVTRAPDRTGGVVKRTVRGVRRLFTGRETTTETVTVRRVERERWPASELAHRLPPRHAVLSVTSTEGESGPPILVRLGD